MSSLEDQEDSQAILGQLYVLIFLSIVENYIDSGLLNLKWFFLEIQYFQRIAQNSVFSIKITKANSPIIVFLLLSLIPCVLPVPPHPVLTTSLDQGSFTSMLTSCTPIFWVPSDVVMFCFIFLNHIVQTPILYLFTHSVLLSSWQCKQRSMSRFVTPPSLKSTINTFRIHWFLSLSTVEDSSSSHAEGPSSEEMT